MDSARFDVAGDSSRLDVAGGEPVVEDEFACAGMLRGSLTSLHTTVERIFRVHFAIGTDQAPHGNDGQIWLKLRGVNSDVQAAKLFVKGVVNQEEQQEVLFPPTLHCVFYGARGLFMDCLIRTTSALVVIGSPTCLLISGLMEPVVRAYSLITDLVDRCEPSQTRHTEPGERVPVESLESRRAFKQLVEQWDDRHTLDLLVLPGTVKEILLDLVKESRRVGDNPSPLLTVDGASRGDDVLDKSILFFRDASDRFDSSFTSSFGDSASVGGRPEGAGGHSKLPQEVGEEDQPLSTNEEEDDGDEEQKLQLSGSKEFWLLLKFFTAMGYTEDVVQRVLAKTGLQEASQILDLVQQEQDRTDRETKAKGLQENVETQDGRAAKDVARNRPCETEHREYDKRVVFGNKRDASGKQNGTVDGASGQQAASNYKRESVKQNSAGGVNEEDFVLGVLKKAAASCGYDERQVTEAYSVPNQSMHELLLELQKNDPRQSYVKEGPREMDDVVIEKEPAKKDRINRQNIGAENRDPGNKRLHKRSSIEEDSMWGEETQKHQKQPAMNVPPKQQNGLTDIRGPPLEIYTNNEPPQFGNYPANQTTSTIYGATARPQPKQGLDVSQHRNDRSPTRTRERRPYQSPAVVVTGEQRFLEGLHSPFELRLTDSPGNPKLRNIIIDGSNVAMGHGLSQFFSCRGIALAVQHFWDRGHRQISALVPQWRTKTDHRIKEQHYLTELNKLGLVSYTPSREVQGKRISSYDDRLMLQLAQKTDGVIVTNDNLRDLIDESPSFRDIIKKRLLQYTFVGDHFMVPDDPLGRGGPHLNDFLSTEPRAPDPGSHTFIPAPFPPNGPRPQIEPANYRDRSPGGAWEPPGGNRRGPRQTWSRPGSEPGLKPDRSPEETARLREELCVVFPEQDTIVTLMLQCHPKETDINTLSALILEDV